MPTSLGWFYLFAGTVLFFFWAYGLVSFVRDAKNKFIPTGRRLLAARREVGDPRPAHLAGHLTHRPAQKFEHSARFVAVVPGKEFAGNHEEGPASTAEAVQVEGRLSDRGLPFARFQFDDVAAVGGELGRHDLLAVGTLPRVVPPDEHDPCTEFVRQPDLRLLVHPRLYDGGWP